MKDYIAKQGDKYWQRGVFLHHSDAQAVVISDEEKKTIVIAINSTSRAAKELLTIIRHTLKSVNGESLTCDEQVPLLVDHKVVGYEDYDYLVECEAQGDEHIRLKIANEQQISYRFVIKGLLDGYRIKDDTRFDYDKLTKDLITISLLETENGHAISGEAEDQTNDRYRTALLLKEYNVADQSRGGKSQLGKSSGERDLVVRNSQTGVAESVIEALIFRRLNTTIINEHYNKLVNSYDTTGNRRNFMVVYVKVATTNKFAHIWQQYQEHFDTCHGGFVDTSDSDSGKDKVKTGMTSKDNKDVFHLFVHFAG
jgi:hypothetical protein